MTGCVNSISPPPVTLYRHRASPSRSSFSLSGDAVHSLYRHRRVSRSPSIIAPKFQVNDCFDLRFLNAICELVILDFIVCGRNIDCGG